MDFGDALRLLKAGKRMTRAGWNGKGMFIAYMPGLKLPPFNSQEPGAKVNDRTAKFIGPDTPLDSQPYFAMKTAAGQWQPGWLASQADMIAEDWQEFDPGPSVTIPIPIASMDGAEAVAGPPSILGGATFTTIAIGVGGSAPRVDAEGPSS